MIESENQIDIRPSEAASYFKPSLIVSMTDDVRLQVLMSPELLKKRQGQFLFEGVQTSVGALPVAVFAEWQDSADAQGPVSFRIVKYQLNPDKSDTTAIWHAQKAKGESIPIGRLPLEETKQKCWSIVEILRTESTSPSEYVVVLYIISLLRVNVNLVVNKRDDQSIEVELPFVATASPKDSLVARALAPLQIIHDVFRPSLEKLSVHTFQEIKKWSSSLEVNALDENFPEIFDDLLYKINSYQGKLGGEYLQPIELSRFVCGLAELPPNSNIYNPFAGVASFGLFVDDSQNYLGQELDRTTWAIGALRMMAYERVGNSVLTQGNSITNWNPRNEKYDLIVASPPFGMRLSGDVQGNFGIIKTCEHFLIEKGIDDLTPDGKLIAVIPHGLLFRGGGERSLREFLVEKGLLEMVISFPGGLLRNTGIPISIIVVSKSKKERGLVRFVDASMYVSSEKKLDDFALARAISSGRKSESVDVVSNLEIKGGDYSLLAKRYRVPKLRTEKGVKLVPLGELVTFLRGRRAEEGEVGRFARVRDLKDIGLNSRLDITTIETCRVPLYSRKISESCVLVASRWRALKPSYFEFKQEPVFIGPDIFALKVDRKLVDMDYLISELHADYVTEQFELFRTGAVVPLIRKEDFLRIGIRLPGLQEQRARIKGAMESYFQTYFQNTLLAVEQELVGFKNDSFRDFASIKHSFRQYLNALKTNVSGTSKFIANHEGKPISANSIYSTKRNETLGEHLISLGGTIELMIRLLDSYEEKTNFSSTPSKVNLENIVLQAQSRFKNPEVFEFEKLHVDRGSFNFEGDIEPIITILEEDFYQIFSNIISNAVDHGFKNTTSGNVVRTSLTYDLNSNMCVLEIANNGKPIPDPFTFEHLITRGEKTTDSSGSGMGGPDIKKLVEKNNGKFELIKQPTEAFPVTYVISFPLARSTDDEV